MNTEKKNYKHCWNTRLIVKKIKGNENFFDALNHSKSTIYFKINLNKLLKKYPVL